MKYELQELTEMIKVKLNPQNLNNQKNKAARMKEFAESISKEVERIITVMQQELFSCDNDKHIFMYAQKYQHGTVRLLDVLHSYLVKTHPGNIFRFPALKTFATGYKKILDNVGQILDVIKNDYYLFFDKRFKIPDFIRASCVSQLQTLINRIRAYFIDNNVENELTSFVVEPFEYFLDMSNEINQTDYDYIFSFEKGISDMFLKNKGGPTEIFDLLLRANFNAPAFTFYYIQKIKFTNAEENVNAAMKHYYRHLKIVNQTQKAPGMVYDPSLPSIQDQLATWLGEEIYFLEKKQLLDMPIAAIKSDGILSSGKVEMNLSVAQISLGLKLLFDTGIIQNKNSSEILRMVSRNFKTKKSEQISEDSLRNKSYNIETVAVQGMKDVIVGLLNEVRKY